MVNNQEPLLVLPETFEFEEIMLKKILSLCLFSLFLICATPVNSCVGRILYIGALPAADDVIMSEMISLLINERTGTTVQIRSFPDTAGLYAALQSEKEEERVDILVEDTIDAIGFLKKTAGPTPEQDLLTAKELYEKELGIIWLNPFGYKNSKGEATNSISAPLVRRDVLTNFPLLPRVLNKLAGAITDKAYQELTKSVSAGDKPKNVAKDFLKKNKFI